MRKSGAKFKNKYSVMPFGVKGKDYELAIRGAMFALENNTCTSQHLHDLYYLAQICKRMNQDNEQHISTHCKSVMKLCEAKFSGECNGLAVTSLTASADVLIRWFYEQNNSKLKDAIVGCM